MKRPNILLLYTDQLRWDAIGINGNPDVRTPHLDQLAKEGLNFDHYFVQNPVCMPSRISFLSGQYPSALRIIQMGVPVPQDIPTLPKMLKNSGYISANIGKLHFLPHANRDHRQIHPDYGFDHLQISDEPGCYEDAYRAWVKRIAPDQLDKISIGLPPAAQEWNRMMNVRDDIVHPEQRFPKCPIAFQASSDLTQAAFVADQTMEFIERYPEQNWFCIAGFYSPHSPWVAPQEFIDLYKPAKLRIPDFPPLLEKARANKPDFSDETLRLARQGYYAMISEVDHHVGRILAKLQALGIADDTLVIFTSDHGEWMGDHLKYGKGYPATDPVSRVPFILRWPQGISETGKTVSTIVEAVDFVPTVLEATGIQVPLHLQGTSLYPYFTGTAQYREEIALTEHKGWKNIRTQSYRYICWDNGEEVLYDLIQDPYEYHNAAGDHNYQQIVSDMRRILIKRILEKERPIPRAWSY